jgi:hypothetical protein
LIPAETVVICEATAVTVQTVPAGRAAVGVSVKVATPPGGAGLRVNASGVPVGHCKVKADAVTFTGTENVMLIGAVASTAVAPLAGVVEDTVGGVPVVKVKTSFAASCVPVASVTWLATTVTVHVVLTGRGALGVKVKVVAFPGGAGAMVKASGVPVGHSSVNAVPVTITALLKVTETVLLGDTSVAPLVGLVEATVGGVSMVKLQVKSLASGVPALTSVTWLAATVAVQTTPAGRFALGVKVKELAPPGGAGEIVKLSGVPLGHWRVNAVPVTLTAALKLTVSVVEADTDVAPFAGLTLVTVGAVSIVKVAVTLAA